MTNTKNSKTNVYPFVLHRARLKSIMRFGELKKAEARKAKAKKRQAIRNRLCGNCCGYDEDSLIKLATFVCVVCMTMRGTPDQTHGTPEQTKKAKARCSKPSELDKLKGNTYEDMRYTKETLTDSILGKRGVELNETKAQERTKKAGKASTVSREPVFRIDDNGAAYEPVLGRVPPQVQTRARVEVGVHHVG